MRLKKLETDKQKNKKQNCCLFHSSDVPEGEHHREKRSRQSTAFPMTIPWLAFGPGLKAKHRTLKIYCEIRPPSFYMAELANQPMCGKDFSVKTCQQGPSLLTIYQDSVILLEGFFHILKRIQMRKIYKLTHPKIKVDRLVEGVKHDVKKYVKRERKKALPKGVDYWDFDCKFGNTIEALQEIHLAEMNTYIDQAKEQQVESFCIEIQVKPGHRMKKSDT